ncbi:MAG TPA: hypothetical protein VNT56_01065 [Acidimicrobiales bacterium]|nr:hypothetical protein [Acidimicrobiales bacterium]
MKQVPELTGITMARPRSAGVPASATTARCRHRGLRAWPAAAKPAMSSLFEGQAIGHPAIPATGSRRLEEPST